MNGLGLFRTSQCSKKLRHARDFSTTPRFKSCDWSCLSHLRPILTMGYYTGMRLSELLGLRWINVDFLNAEARLDPGTTKNDEPRTVPLVGELQEMLKIEREKNPTAEFVFTRNGQRTRSFYKGWKSAACKRVGLSTGSYSTICAAPDSATLCGPTCPSAWPWPSVVTRLGPYSNVTTSFPGATSGMRPVSSKLTSLIRTGANSGPIEAQGKERGKQPD